MTITRSPLPPTSCPSVPLHTHTHARARARARAHTHTQHYHSCYPSGTHTGSSESGGAARGMGWGWDQSVRGRRQSNSLHRWHSSCLTLLGTSQSHTRRTRTPCPATGQSECVSGRVGQQECTCRVSVVSPSLLARARVERTITQANCVLMHTCTNPLPGA